MYQILDIEDYNFQKLKSNGGTEYETVTTEKSETIFVEDVAKTKGKLIPFGNTYQKQLTGSNMLNENTIKNASYTTTGTYKNTITDLVGQTLYFMAQLKEGKSPISGLYVAISSNGNNPNNGVSAYSILNGVIDTTKMSANFENVTNIYFATYPKSISIEDIFDTYNFWVSDSDTTYEEFCGKQASPNPNYPQNIEVVSGDNTITLSDGTNTESYPLNLGTIELCKIGDYQDRIYKENGKWYLQKEIGKIVLNGTESWNKDISLDNLTDYFYIANIGIDTRNINSVYTNYFIKGNSGKQGFWASTVFAITINKTETGIVSTDTKQERIVKFKDWLSAHNTSVYYALLTPTNTEITDQTLISELEEIYNINLFIGTNIITTETLNLKPELQLTYKRIKQNEGGN